MRKASPDQQPSKQEISVADAESRKDAAESALISAGEAKKAVEEKIIALNETVKVTQDTISRNNDEIHAKSEKLIELRESIRKESEELFLLQDRKNSAIGDISSAKKEASDIRTLSARELSEARTAHAAIIDGNKKEIVSSLAEKASADAEARDAKENLKNLKNLEVIELKKSDDRKIAMETSVAESKAQDDFLKTLKNKSAEQEALIKQGDLELSHIDQDISEKGEKIESLDRDIAKKTEEYKALETKAFVILRREEALNQKEAFIKSQYDRAGIPWIA